MITVFTPTYNRAYSLPQLYASLQRQTSKSFEWVIVDDGSTDETCELLDNWRQEEKQFEIRFMKKENGGKHTAINMGVSNARYDWFFIVDSDDYLRDDAIEKAEKWISEISDDRIGGVSGTKVFPSGQMIGQSIKLPRNGYIDAKNTERNKYGLGGDKAEIYRTDVLKQFPFPVFEGEKFLSEVCVWNEIAAHGYQVRWYNYPLQVCDYLNDGLTYQVHNNDLNMKNFQGYLYCMKYNLMSCKRAERLRRIYRYVSDARKKGYRLKEFSISSGIPYWETMLAVFFGTIYKIVKGIRSR